MVKRIHCDSDFNTLGNKYLTLPRSWPICSWQKPFLPMVISGRTWIGQLFFVEKSQFLWWLFLKIDLAILGDFEKKLDNFEKCYYHFCFTNLVTQFCLTSICHGHSPFLEFFRVFSYEKGKHEGKTQKNSKNGLWPWQTVLSYQICKTEMIVTLFKIV